MSNWSKVGFNYDKETVDNNSANKDAVFHSKFRLKLVWKGQLCTCSYLNCYICDGERDISCLGTNVLVFNNTTKFSISFD